MRKYGILSLFVLSLFISTALAQKIHKSKVPSLVINSFHQQFPRAYDVEWKMEQNIYKVEFETGIRGHDHTVWYDPSGKIIRHKEEMTKHQLPDAVLSKLNAEYKNYRISDVKKITEGNKILYTLELKKAYEEWKISIDSDGTILSKIPD